MFNIPEVIFVIYIYIYVTYLNIALGCAEWNITIPWDVCSLKRYVTSREFTKNAANSFLIGEDAWISC